MMAMCKTIEIVPWLSITPHIKFPFEKFPDPKYKDEIQAENMKICVCIYMILHFQLIPYK